MCVCVCVCEQEYGSLECAPDEIKARIVEVEQLSMTEVYKSHSTLCEHM